MQDQVLPNLAIGVECFRETAQSAGDHPSARANLGLTWDLDSTRHILISAGPGGQGESGYQAYLAYQLTFGPAH